MKTRAMLGLAVDRGAYIFCVLEQFCRHLKHREIYAEASTRHRNPQARLLEGAMWEAVKDDVLTTLSLPEAPDALPASTATTSPWSKTSLIVGVPQSRAVPVRRGPRR
ncbi:hypothetical protein ACWEJ6_31535 [Nonomuraea sp. NPDC004702]